MHVGSNSSLTRMHAQTHGHERTHTKRMQNVQRRHNNNVNRYEATYDITTTTFSGVSRVGLRGVSKSHTFEGLVKVGASKGVIRVD